MWDILTFHYFVYVTADFAHRHLVNVYIVFCIKVIV